MKHVKPALGLKVAAIVLLGLGTAVTVPASAYAGTGPGGRCNGSWSAGYTNSGYTASCTVSGGLPGTTSPYQFRVRITCVRAARPNVTVYGNYSNWKSSANCASGYDPTSPVIQWVHL